MQSEGCPPRVRPPPRSLVSDQVAMIVLTNSRCIDVPGDGQHRRRRGVQSGHSTNPERPVHRIRVGPLQAITPSRVRVGWSQLEPTIWGQIELTEPAGLICRNPCTGGRLATNRVTAILDRAVLIPARVPPTNFHTVTADSSVRLVRSAWPGTRDAVRPEPTSGSAWQEPPHDAKPRVWIEKCVLIFIGQGRRDHPASRQLRVRRDHPMRLNSDGPSV